LWQRRASRHWQRELLKVWRRPLSRSAPAPAIGRAGTAPAIGRAGTAPTRQISRRQFVQTAAAGSLALAGMSVGHQTSAQPNIVFLLADDLGYADVSCYGQCDYTTPNIDRPAIEGMRSHRVTPSDLFATCFQNPSACAVSPLTFPTLGDLSSQPRVALVHRQTPRPHLDDLKGGQGYRWRLDRQVQLLCGWPQNVGRLGCNEICGNQNGWRHKEMADRQCDCAAVSFASENVVDVSGRLTAERDMQVL
jgi:hypothetical protein